MTQDEADHLEPYVGTGHRPRPK